MQIYKKLLICNLFFTNSKYNNNTNKIFYFVSITIFGVVIFIKYNKKEFLTTYRELLCENGNNIEITIEINPSDKNNPNKIRINGKKYPDLSTAVQDPEVKKLFTQYLNSNPLLTTSSEIYELVEKYIPEIKQIN